MKGVSQLASAAILLMVAMALAMVYSSWAPNFARNITQGALEDTQQERRCGNAALSIRDPVYDKTGTVILFDLENTGTIRFTNDITVAAFNSSLPVNQTTVNGLEVEESVSTQIQSSKIPDYLAVVSSADCPEIEEREELITVRK